MLAKQHETRLRIRHMNPVARDQRRLAWILLMPWILGFLAFSLYPTAASLYFSFTRYNLFEPPHWIGLANYESIISSGTFWQSLYNTIYYTVFGVGFALVLGLGSALLLNLKVRGQAIYRTIYFLPSVMPPVASALLWLWLLNPQYGLINTALGYLHLPQPLWLISAVWAKPALILMGLWGTGTTTIIYLAGLQDIPQVYYEALEMDGGGSWQKFRYITLPMLSPITFFQLVMGLIGALGLFTTAYVLSMGSIQSLGGPDNSLLFYSVNIYEQAFSNLKMGYASALAWILLIITVLITWIIYRSSKRWLYYGGQ